MIMVNTQGIVLRTVRYEENDVILTLFTRKLGKIAAIAKGAKRSKSSLLSSSQLFSYSNFTIKKNKDMYTVSQSEVINSFYNISYDIDAFSYATYICSLVEGSTYENQSNNRLFILLAQTLYLYSQNDVDKLFITKAFELKFLDYIGFRPVVNKCSVCGNNKSIEYKFNTFEGGIVCKECSNTTVDNKRIDKTTIKLMEYILSNDIIKCSKAKVSKYITYDLDNLLRGYILNYIDNVNLKSLNLLKNLDTNKE